MKGRILIVVGLCLILGAGGLTAWNLWTEQRAGEERDRIMDQLSAELESRISSSPEAVPTASVPVDETPEITDPAPETPAEETPAAEEETEPPTELPAVTLDSLNYIGFLSIPVLDLRLPVLREWSYENLKVSPSVYYGSVYTHDLVICAHNYRTHFGPLRNLTVGNRLTFTDMDGNVYEYEVAKTEEVSPYATADVTSGEWALTLFTCTLGGQARTVIRCDLVATDNEWLLNEFVQ